jgi:hypothetical protein
MRPSGSTQSLRRQASDVWDAHEIKLVTSTGLTFAYEIAVATTTPQPGPRLFAVFALVGLYVGVIPVAIGLLWYPLLRGLEPRWLNFALALTAGLLIFLGVDAVHEALEAAGQVAGAFQGVLLVVVGSVGTLLLLQMISRARLNLGGLEGRKAVAFLKGWLSERPTHWEKRPWALS